MWIWTNREGRGSQEHAGFTLLEMMAAVAIIAIAVVALMGSQSQSVSTATISRFNITASLLAQQKLAELAREDTTSLSADEGDFAEPYDPYRWQLEVDEVSEDDLGISAEGDLLKKIDLTISLGEEPRFTYTVRALLMNKIEPREQQ